MTTSNAHARAVVQRRPSIDPRASNVDMRPLRALNIRETNTWQYLFPNLHAILLAECNPQGLARGISLGIALGLVPKGNLVALVLLAMLFVWRCNLLAGLASCLIISLFAYHLDPAFDAIGSSVLSLGPLQPVFRGLFAVPWVPWTRLDNTVVAGSLIVGLLQFYPTQYLVRRWTAAHREERHETEPYAQRMVP